MNDEQKTLQVQTLLIGLGFYARRIGELAQAVDPQSWHNRIDELHRAAGRMIEVTALLDPAAFSQED
jgi:hypothetical protein